MGCDNITLLHGCQLDYGMMGSRQIMNASETPILKTLKRAPGLVERTEEQLEKLIVAGSYRPGQRMSSERELGLQLGISKTVVREAIRSLAARGLVEVR